MGSAVVSGCATPQPLVRLAPDVNDVVWVAGRASVQQAAGGVRVASAFERQAGDKLALRVEVQNGTAGRLEVEPRHITFSLCQTLAVETCRPSRRVIDPEQMLSSIDTDASRGAAAAVNEQVLLGTVGLLATAADVAAASSGHADRTTGLRTAVAWDAADRSAAAAETSRASLAEQRVAWSDLALRRNTLFPGQAVGGLVYIPTDERARFVWLQVRVGDHTFPFHFAQTVTQVPLSPPPDHPSTANR